MKSARPRSGGSTASTKLRIHSRRRRARSAISAALAATTARASASGDTIPASVCATMAGALAGSLAAASLVSAFGPKGRNATIAVVIMRSRSRAASSHDLEAARVRARALAVPNHTVDKLRCAHRILRYLRLGHRCCLFVKVDPVDLLGHGQIVGVFLEEAPSSVLRQKPHAVGQVREIHRAVVIELHVIRVVPFLADAIVVDAFE